MFPKMQAAVIEKDGQKQLELKQLPLPELTSATDILIEIYAASINPIDLKIMEGGMKFLLHYQMPLILGNDFAGKIIKIGSKVTDFKVGDEVYGRVNKSRIGTFAQYVTVDQTDIALKPTNLTWAEAASIPLVGLTSYQALHDIMQLQAGNKLFIASGSGGVGTFGIQLAKIMGAQVATTTSSKNFSLVKELGADTVIDYKKDNFAEVLKNYDYAFDTRGGTDLMESFKILHPDGKLVSLAGKPNLAFAKEYGLPKWKQILLKLISRDITKLEKLYKVNYIFLFMKPSGKELAIITKMIESNKIKPVIDRVFPLKNIQQAIDYSAAGHAKGKIVIEIKQ